MPTAEYYQTIKLLNDKYEDNWVIAMEMCSEEEKSFIREALGASDYVQDGLKEITLTKRNDGLLGRRKRIYKKHPEYSDILVSNNGRIFRIEEKVSESQFEVTYTTKRYSRISYNHIGNPTISILGVPVSIKSIVYDTFVGDRKKNEVIININGDKRDNRLSNLKKETPLDRLMKSNLYPHLNEIVEMQKRNVKLEFIAGKFRVTRNTLVWFLYRARKLGVIE
ncbi:HNH endonuclease [Enterococcus cecorum]|nr:HNH endonuclease [Enterococcus cecorum]